MAGHRGERMFDCGRAGYIISSEERSGEMKVMKQLSIFLANRPGTLASVCKELADSGINIQAMTVVDSVDHAVVRMVVSDPDTALHILGERGTLALESDVVVIDIPNEPGGLKSVASKLARARINIEYAYCTASEEHDVGTLVLKTENPAGTLRVLKGKSKRKAKKK